MRSLWSITLLRRTSVGCAVSTGAISAFFQQRSDRCVGNAPTPQLPDRMRDIGARLRRHALPILGQVGEHRKQHETAHERQCLVQAEGVEARSIAPASATPRCRSTEAERHIPSAGTALPRHNAATTFPSSRPRNRIMGFCVMVRSSAMPLRSIDGPVTPVFYGTGATASMMVSFASGPSSTAF